MRKISPLFPILLLVACNLPHGSPDIQTVTETPGGGYEGCAWTWATQPLPELSAQVQSAMDAAALAEVVVSAEAYGENCITASGSVDGFAAMETDFYITINVESLTDGDHLGNLLEQVLIVLDGFPSGATPGPQEGYVGVAFQAGSDGLNLWFPFADGESARALGLHGRALLEKLQDN